MYQHFMIDPPWPKKKGGRRAVRPNQGRSLDYPVMTIPAIFQLLEENILPLAAPEHNIFLWNVEEFLIPGESAMLDLGYKRHTRIIWDKTNGVAPAFTLRFAHEYLTWFYKGKFQNVAPEARGKLTTVIQEKARQHSRKPDGAYNLIDFLYPGVTKLDVFSRETRPGWNQYGNQVNYFNGG